MARTRPTDYAGALGRADLATAARSRAGYVVQPKLDGCYCTARTDRAGRLFALRTRGGQAFPAEVLRDFAGVRWAPDSTLVGELEAWTEAANRTAAARGYRVLHLFDALAVGGVDLAAAPYRARRDALMRAEAQLVQDDLDRPWSSDEHGRAHDPLTGRYIAPVPRTWRRVRVAPQLPAHQAERAWTDWVDRDGAGGPSEGLVLVALDARLGARASKRKVKRAETIDAAVLEHDGQRAAVAWVGGTFIVPAAGVALTRGQVVEVVHEGFYESGARHAGRSFGAAPTPRFPRIVRSRPDLVA